MKRILFAFLYLIGAPRLAAWRNRWKVTILCYHGVTERARRSSNDPGGLHVGRQRFSRQLDYLKRNYHVLSLKEYISAREAGRTLPPYSVILTFDDGYRNFLTVATPQLAQRAMPATVFLITDGMRSNHSGQYDGWMESDDEHCLSWDEARRLSLQHGIEFGSHTCSHSKLTTLSPQVGLQEMEKSLTAVARELQMKEVFLAYPYGDYSDSLSAQARALGYGCAVTTDEGPNDQDANLFKLRRTLIGADDDEPAFAARVSGLIALLRGGKTAYPETT